MAASAKRRGQGVDVSGEDDSMSTTETDLGLTQLTAEQRKRDPTDSDEFDSLDSDEIDPNDITATGVIRIMKANGREQMADLIDSLRTASERVAETQQRAEKLLLAFQKLHHKRTGAYPKIPRRTTKDEA